MSRDDEEAVVQMKRALTTFRETARHVVRKSKESHRNLRLILSTPTPPNGIPRPNIVFAEDGVAKRT